MTVNLRRPIASLDAHDRRARPGTRCLSTGTHVVSIRSQDAADNWGAPVTVDLVRSTRPGPRWQPSRRRSGPEPEQRHAADQREHAGGPGDGDPDVHELQLSPRPKLPLHAPNVACAVGANGTGIPLLAVDGTFNSPSEAAYADIPLATIITLSNGDHTIYVHGKDAAGNWGATSSTTLVIDKIAPAIVSITRPDANPTSAASVQFLVTFSEPVKGIDGRQLRPRQWHRVRRGSDHVGDRVAARPAP